jgi:hypothetical protein
LVLDGSVFVSPTQVVAGDNLGGGQVTLPANLIDAKLPRGLTLDRNMNKISA